MAKHGKTILTGSENEEVSIRKIENGWIISHTVKKKHKDGGIDFETTETFTADKPDI